MGYAFVNNHLIECGQNDLPTWEVTPDNEPTDWCGDEYTAKAWMWFPTLEAAERRLRFFAHNDFQRLLQNAAPFFPDKKRKTVSWRFIPKSMLDKFIAAHREKWGKYALNSFEHWQLSSYEKDAYQAAVERDLIANKLTTKDRWPDLP